MNEEKPLDALSHKENARVCADRLSHDDALRVLRITFPVAALVWGMFSASLTPRYVTVAQSFLLLLLGVCVWATVYACALVLIGSATSASSAERAQTTRRSEAQ